MLIGIDGNEANTKSRVGIGEYSFELLKQFKRFQISPSGTHVTNNLKFQIYLKSNPLLDLPEESENWQYRVIRPGKLWTQWRLPLDLYLNSPRPDVFFSPSHYAPRFSPVPSVISVMDLSYLYFPQMFNSSDLYQLKNWTAYSVKNASKVLTISKSSKNDIIASYGLTQDKVIATYLGVKQFVSLSPNIYPMNILKTKYKISDNYILFVGTLQPRKNIERLIEAFSKIDISELKVKDLQLIIVGKKGWLYESILSAPKTYGVEGSVKFLATVDNDELQTLYTHAKCFVLPSLYEGFGLPVLEAMQAGCPVIASNVSSLPEAGGEACLYVDPEDVDDIWDKIVKLVNNEKLRKELIEKGKEQVKKFSWEKTALETLKVLEEAGKA